MTPAVRPWKSLPERTQARIPPMLPDPVTRLVRSCDPDAYLKPGDPRYVDLTLARGEGGGGWGAKLQRQLRQTDRACTFLVSGFLGDGKTTELRRLQKSLTETNPKLAVVYVDSSEYLNGFEYSFSQLLLAVIAETGKQLNEQYGVDLKPTYVAQKIDEMKKLLLSDVELQEIEAEASGQVFKASASIALKARTSHQVREQLGKALGQDRTTLNREFSRSLNETARPELREKGYQDLVIIIDWLEKLVDAPPTDDRPVSAHHALFLHHAPLINEWGTQVVMTVPISMVYSASQKNLTQAYGSNLTVINQVAVAKFLDKTKRERALDAMREVLRRRAAHAPDGPVEYNEVFASPGLADDLICLSGGHLRVLMMLVRQCCSFIDKLPITREAVDAAVREEVLIKSRAIKESWFDKLAKIHRTHAIDNDGDHMEMLVSLFVLAYGNNETRYDVDPMVTRLDKFKAAIKAYDSKA